jgi:hypothetical protein
MTTQQHGQATTSNGASVADVLSALRGTLAGLSKLSQGMSLAQRRSAIQMLQNSARDLAEGMPKPQAPAARKTA